MFRFTVQNFRSKILVHSQRIGISSPPNRGKMKVAICGAAGQCGQATALLLKLCPLIDELTLYDVNRTAGISQELNHIDTSCKVFSYSGKIKEALENAHIVAIVARAPKTSRLCDVDAFKSNALIMCTLVSACAQFCPKAMIAIATNPINSLIPLAAELLKKHGVYKPNHLFGITTVDVMRVNSLVAHCHGLTPEKVYVPVIGGSSKTTKIPLLSLTKPASEFTPDEITTITQAVRNSSDDLLEKSKSESPFLSNSSSIAQFVTSLARAIKGEKGVIECCYVPFDDFPNIGYFATPVEFGIDGLQRNFGIPKLSDYEYCLFLSAIDQLKRDIKLGIKHIKPSPPMDPCVPLC